jgi:hypothetical protein
MHLVLLKLELVLQLDLPELQVLLQHFERQVVSVLVVSVLAPLVLQVLAVLEQVARGPLVLLQQEQLAQEFPA